MTAGGSESFIAWLSGRLPGPTPPHGGSMTMACVGSAVLDGCT
ncbi:hypothetical protein ACIRO1_03645 [Streptomyces sp. NPDC102381]